MTRADTNYATPTRERAVAAYPPRRGYVPGAIHPPEVPNVEGAIDIHCHAHEEQQDALAVAKLASANGMRGILYKTIVGRKQAAAEVRRVQDELNRWCETQGFTPITCWAGCSVTERPFRPIRVEHVREQLDSGVIAVWMPNVNSANTYYLVGGKPILWDPDADPSAHTEPLPWDEALKVGHYLLDEKGRLKDDIAEIIRMAADRDAALFFGHATHDEIWAMAELVDKLKFKRAVIDHPFSPFVDLNFEEMKQAGAVGITLNFTFDELSPLLGVDPAKMYQAIREVGVAHCTLSSDAGEPLFPNSVECMRLMRAYMEAFGLSREEITLVSEINPAAVVGLNL